MDSIFFLLSYLVCSQIWLNHLIDDHHFSYITKLKKQKPLLASKEDPYLSDALRYSDENPLLSCGWGGKSKKVITIGHK
jgi:hypothetical protein